MCSKCPTPSGGFFNQYLSRYNSSAINVNTDTSSASNVITRTQAFRRSLPNQWAQSQLEFFNADQLSMSTGTQALDLSMPNQWARSPKLLMSTEHLVVTINAKPMGTILNLFVKTRNDYSLAVNSMESPRI